MLCPYETFIVGETIDLVVPDQSAVDEGRWHRWFNDQNTTRYLDQGDFPNTPKQQKAFLDVAQGPESNRLVLLVWAKDAEKLVGVVSLSSINLKRRSAEAALVIGEKTGTMSALFHGLEAKARITAHAFENMGVERVSGAQAVSLAEWQKYQLLFGFRLEGINRKSHRKGHNVEDTVSNACLLQDYLDIKKRRGGDYWPGKVRLIELMREMPKGSPVENLQVAIDTAMDDYLAKINWA